MQESFDKYIDNYRIDQDKAVALSGESSAFFAAYKTQKMMKWFEDLIAEPISILDFGCGDGLMTNFVKEAFWKARVVGVDSSEKSIEVAENNYPAIDFYKTNDTRLNFPDAIFDLVFAAGVFHHIPFEQHEAHLQEIIRVLKPGGFFILFELNTLNPLTVRTFKRNPIDQDARMMHFWYSKKLLSSHGNAKTIFYCFFPKILSFLRRLEPYLIWLPVGALYASIVKKK